MSLKGVVMWVKRWAMVSIATVILTGCGLPPTEPPPPSPSIEEPTSSPRSTESDNTRAGDDSQPDVNCDTEFLRAALDDEGDRFLKQKDESGAGFYDVFKVEKCGARFAIVEANHTSGSLFNYFALKRGQRAWHFFAVASVRLETQTDEPLTWDPGRSELGSDWDAFVNEMGPTIGPDRPLQ